MIAIGEGRHDKEALSLRDMDVTSLPTSEYARLDYLQRRRLYLNQCSQKGVVPKGSHVKGSDASARYGPDQIRKIKEVVRDQAEQIKELQEAYDSDNDDIFGESDDESPQEANRNNTSLVRYAPDTKPGSVRQPARAKKKRK